MDVYKLLFFLLFSFCLSSCGIEGSITQEGSEATNLKNISLIQKPNVYSSQANPSFEFLLSSSEAASEIEYLCRLDQNQYSECSNPKTFTLLSEGVHSFQVKAMKAGQELSAETKFDWTIDHTAPTTPIISGPPVTSYSTSATFTFSSSDSSAGIDFYECQLDAGTFSNCGSPISYTGISSAAHTFRVRATDRAGNVSLAANYNWTKSNLPIPSALAMVDPVVNRGGDSTPTIKISGVLNGLTVGLYSDSSCSTLVKSGLATSTEIDLIASALTTEATYSYWAQTSDGAGSFSACSSASLSYDFYLSTFVSTWQTTALGQSITLPIVGGFSYNFDVDWGDSSTSNVSSSGDPDRIHTYAIAGTYIVKITGTLQAWSFRDVSTSRDQIIRVDNLGSLDWRSLSGAFESSSSLIYLAGGNTSQVTDMRSAFYGTSNVKVETSGWNTANVTSMNHMFYATNQANPDTSNWNTSNVIDMRGMFEAAQVANPNTSNWNTANVQDMDHVFGWAPNANPDVSNWSFASATQATRMFIDAVSATPNTSNWNFGTLTDLSQMFSGAINANPNMTSWNVSNITNFSGFLNGVTIPVSSYSNFLIKLQTQNLNPNVTLDGGNSKYNPTGATSRGVLLGNGWTISDGGPE